MGRKKKSKNARGTSGANPEVDRLYSRALSTRDIEAVYDLLRKDPLHVDGLILLSTLLLEKDNRKEAVSALNKVAILAPGRRDILLQLGINAARDGQTHEALCAMRRLLDMDPKNQQAPKWMAGLFGSLGMEEQSRAFALQASKIEPYTTARSSLDTRLKVIILGTIASGSYRYNHIKGKFHRTEGHNNLGSLLDKSHITRYNLWVDALDELPRLLEKLPRADIVYNSITDANRCREALQKAENICSRLNLPVVNHPAAVMQTSRESNYQSLKDAPGIIFPKSVCLGELSGNISETIRQAAEEHGLQSPVIMRAAGFQGGKHMHLLNDMENLNVTLKKPAIVYLIEYVDVSFTDDRAPGVKLYPKYRAMLAGGKLFPAHRFAAINDFNVHRKNWEQAKQKFPWLIDGQQKYLDDPENRFAPGKWRELEQALAGLDLDYLGVDFGPDQEGNMVVFETNPAMRNRLTEHPAGEPVQQAWVHITWAMHELFCKRAGVEPWDFELPGLNVEACRLLISGKVQKVGYRKWLANQLKQNGMTGWVRNLNDGRVEAVVHGPPDSVKHLSKVCRQGPPKSVVEAVEAEKWDLDVPQGVFVYKTASAPQEAA